MSGIEDIKDESFVKAEIHNSINYMLDCLLEKEERKCNSCKCVDACSLLTEAVFICRARKIKQPNDRLKNDLICKIQNYK